MWQLPPLKAEEIVIYLRKSRADDPLLSVEEVLAKHEQMLNEWVSRNLPDVGRVPEANRFREVVSGETIDSRPRVQALLQRVESPEYKAVLIVEPQRLSRGDLEDIGRLVKLLRYSNTIVITLQYTYDLRDERDRDMFERELKRGNEFLEYQKRIMGNGRVLSAQNGNFIGSIPPYGYNKVEVKDGKNVYPTLEPHPEQAPIVKMIFEMSAQGCGYVRIADRLYEMGVEPPGRSNGRPVKSKFWSRASLRNILTNEHYIGMVRWQRRKTVKTVEEGEVVARRPVAEEYMLSPGKHPAIIERELWDAVQKRIGTSPKVRKNSKPINPYAGLLYCGTCGLVMKMHTGKLADGSARNAPRMQCTESKICKTASCSVTELTVEVRRVLKETLEDIELRIESGEDNSVEVHRQALARLERRLTELDALELSQWDKYTQEGMPKHIFDALNKKVLDEKEEVREAIRVAKESIPEPVDLETKAATLHQVIDMLDDPNAPVKELNLLLKECIESIRYWRKRTPGQSPTGRIYSPFEIVVDLKL